MSNAPVELLPLVEKVGDTTELVTDNGKLFLAAILDLFSRYVVGWALSASNDRFLTMKALDMAIRRRSPDAGLLHHSDQGSTYASEDYQKVLTAHGITCSMSRRGNVHDNAVAEDSTRLSSSSAASGSRRTRSRARRRSSTSRCSIISSAFTRPSATSARPTSRGQHG